MTKQRHIIGRTVLELDTGRIANVWSLQEDLSRLFQQQGVQEIERLFDELVGDGEVMRLDRVVVEIGAVDRRFLADEFIRNLLNALRQTLGDHLADRLVASAKTENMTRDTSGKALGGDRSGSDWEILLYFLRYGRLPWWCPSGDWQAWFPRWEAVMQSDTPWQQSLRELLRISQTARQRLIEQLPESFLHQLILQLQPTWAIWPNLLAQARQLIQSGELDSSNIRYLDRQTWLLLLGEISADNAPTKPFPITWTRNWLAQLVEIWQQQRPDLNKIRQRLRDTLEAVPSDEQTLWLTALDQVTARSLDQPQPAEEFSPNLQSSTPSPKTDWQVLLYFLQYGRLPSEQASENWQDWLQRWESVIQNETAWQQPLRELLRNNVAARQRLLAQFPEAFLHQLILQLQPAWTTWHILLAQAKQLMQSLSISSDSFEELLTQAWELLLAEISLDNSSVSPLPATTWTHNWLAQLVQNWRWPSEPASQPEDRRPDDNLNQIAQERLRTSIDAVSHAQRPLWLNAYSQVLESKARSPQNTQDSPQTDWQVLLYFLQHGRLPSEQASENWQDWLKRWGNVIQTETAWQMPLRELLVNNVAARQRLIAQFPEAFLHQLILQLQPAWTTWHILLAQAKQLMQSLSISSDSFQELLTQAWELLLAEISADNTSVSPLPATTWTRNWLAQLVQNWRWLSEPGSQPEVRRPDDNLNQIAQQRLRTIIDAVSRAQRPLWLNAYNQVLESKARSPQNTQNTQDSPQTDWQVLLYFLQHGHLPREQASEDWQDWLQRWETVIQNETAWQMPLRELLRNNVASLQRLITQFPESWRHQLVLQLQPAWINWHTLLAQARELMQSLNLSNDIYEQLNQQAWLLLLAEISSDNALARPFPAATWTRNWLTQLVQSWRSPVANPNQITATSPPVEAAAWTQNNDSDSQETGNQNSRQHLRNAIATLPITESTLWLNALDKAITATSADTSTAQDERQTSALPTIPEESSGVPVPQNEIDAAPPAETNTFSDRTTTPIEEPTPSLEQIELDTQKPTNPQRIPPRRARGSTLSTEEETADLYINQAGLVLLHPFLRIYLDEVGLLDGESFRDELAQQIAIYLLHYLATKQTDAPEYELVLPKLLCGWPLDEPVSRGLDLPAIALTEGENLLQTVINYWEVLKSTSPDGLRDGFLQRAGKLTRSDDGNWKLQVEQQAIDILLSRLPWGLSMVKLPWMDDILIVEWH